MNEDLLNVMGSFSEISLDCIEKQNEEIEQLKQERDKYKSIVEEVSKWLEEQKQFIEDIPTFSNDIKNNHFGMIGAYRNTLDKLKELEEGNNND